MLLPMGVLQLVLLFFVRENFAPSVRRIQKNQGGHALLDFFVRPAIIIDRPFGETIGILLKEYRSGMLCYVNGATVTPLRQF